jgi:predicted nucleotidyltransferase
MIGTAAAGLSSHVASVFWIPSALAAGVLMLAMVHLWQHVRGPLPVPASSFDQLTDADLKAQVTNWLITKLSVRAFHITAVTLFGSVVHNHFKTSDVDVIVRFAPLRERQIALAVRKIKGPMSSEFKRQFGHDLHVKFFCAEEVEGYNAFLASTKHESII